MRPEYKRGFTLIELSIVLVIIGLIVGGILVGQDLIHAAAIRAQVGQIEKYNAAVNTFRSKYNGIPGDLAVSQAQAFGFDVTGMTGAMGFRNGDGLLEDCVSNVAVYSAAQGYGNTDVATCGETALFWQDLSAAGLIAAGGLLSGGNFSAKPSGTVAIANYAPPAQIGNGNYVLASVPSAMWTVCNLLPGSCSKNAYSIIADKAGVPGTGLTAAEAYAIDNKIDDGYPASGLVMGTIYYYSNTSWNTNGLNLVNIGNSSTGCAYISGSQYLYNTQTGAGQTCIVNIAFQ